MIKKLYNLSIYLIFFSTPFESVGIIPGFSVVKLASIIFIFFSITQSKIKPNFRDSLPIIISAYVFLSILSMLWTIDIEKTINASLLTLFPTLLVVLCLYYTKLSKIQIFNILTSYILSSIIVAVSTIYMYYTKFQYLLYGYQRATVFNQDQNELSFLLLFGLVCSLYLSLFFLKSNTKKILNIFSMLIMVYAILLTGSRTGFVCLIVVLAILFIHYLKDVKKITYLLPFGLLIFFVLNVILSDNVSERLLNFSDVINQTSGTRISIWKRGIDAFLNDGNIVLGIGFDSFRTMMDNNYGYRNSQSVHNTYLVTFIELGIIGLVIYFKLLLDIIRKTWFLIKYHSIFNLALILPLLITMMTLGIHKRRWLFLIAILIFHLYSLKKYGNLNAH